MAIQREEKTIRYKLEKLDVIAALELENVLQFEFDGANLVVVFEEVETPNTPRPKVTKCEQTRVAYPWQDLRERFFPDVEVNKVYMTFDAEHIYITTQL